MNELKRVLKEREQAISNKNWKAAADLSNCIANKLRMLGKINEAINYHTDELEFTQRVQYQLGIAIANRNLGECYAELAQFKKSVKHIKEYMQTTVELGNKIEQQRAWATLGRTYFLKFSQDKEDKKDRNYNILDQAEESYLRALELLKDLKSGLKPKDYAEMKARCLLNLGLVWEDRGDIKECGEYIKQAIYLASKYNLHEDLNRCQSSLAGVYREHGQYRDALRLLDSAIKSAERLNKKDLVCDELLSKAGILALLKDFNGAKHSLVKAYKLRHPIEQCQAKITKFLKIYHLICLSEKKLGEITPEDCRQRKLILEKIADCLSTLGSYKLALEYYFLTLKCMENSIFVKSEKAPIYFSIAETYKDMDDPKKALEYLYLELDYNEDKPDEQIKTLWRIAEILEETKQEGELEKAYLKTIDLAEMTGNKKAHLQTLNDLLLFYEKSGMTEKTETVKMKLKDTEFCDLSSDESEIEKEEPFDDVNISEISDCVVSEGEKELDAIARPRRRRAKAVFKRNEKGETPLHQACISGDMNAVQRLIESGHPVNERDYCGWSPLHEACNFGYYDIVEYLLDKGAFINDRGGPNCEGITPLHDAASCGNLDIMKLLVSRGASVTVLNDKGETPLLAFLQWKRTNRNDLDASSLESCKKVEETIKEKMSLAGQSAEDSGTTYEVPFQDAVQDSSDSSLPPSPKQKRATEKRLRSPSSSSGRDSDDISDSAVCPPYLDEKRHMDDARSEYQNVMLSLRRSAKSVFPKASSPVRLDSGPALITEEQVNTEWLMDDMMRNEKVKRKPKKKSRLNIRTSKSLCNIFPSIHVTNSTNKDDIESFIIQENSSDTIPPVNESARISAPAKNVERNGTQSSRSDSSKLSFCLRVRISDKLILVPVVDDTCSIGWLTEQASQRYQDLVGSRPHLTLMRKDGALLSNSDVVKTLFVDNEEVLSSIQCWDETSLEERYVQNCNKRRLKVSDFIRNICSDFASSSKLNFSKCPLPLPHMNAVFSSMSNFKSLQLLDISGTPIMDTGANEIISCFAYFISLDILDMSCCCLTSETTKNIAEYLHKQDSKLPNLKTLILDHNVFYSDCSSDFNAILQLPSLTTLSLRSCNLIPTFFENTDLCQALKAQTKLQEFNISENSLSQQSLVNYLRNLPTTNLQKLDLSHIECDSNFGGLMNNFLKRNPLLLQEINLEGCNLKNGDIEYLKEGLRQCSHLKCCNISSNYALNLESVILFVECIALNASCLSDLFLTGTCEWDITSVSSLLENFENMKHIKCIKLDSLPELAKDALFQFWKQRWNSKAECHSIFSYCELNVL